MSLSDTSSTDAISKSGPLSVQMALVIVMLSGVYADNWDDDAEQLVLKQIMCKSPIFKENTDEDDDECVEQASEYIQSNPNALKAACGALPDPLKPTAYAMACEIIFADHVLDPSEMLYMEELAGLLSIDDEQARTIFGTFEALYRDV